MRGFFKTIISSVNLESLPEALLEMDLLAEQELVSGFLPSL